MPVRIEARDVALLHDLDAELAQPCAETLDQRVCLHVPLLGEVEAGPDAVVQGRLELMDLLLAEHVVRQLVALAPEPLEAAQHLAGAVGGARRADHAQLPHVEPTPSSAMPSIELEAAPAERRESDRPAIVVALVAVRPEPQQPGRQPRQVARPEVQRRVGPHERPQPVDRQARLRQRPGLGGSDPAAVPPDDAVREPTRSRSTIVTSTPRLRR